MVLPVVDRKHALAFRQHSSHLHQRLPRGRFADAAFAGLQDSSPRSAVLSLHARVRDVPAVAWEDPQLVQIWGPRGADYVVPARDVAVFTLGRLPRDRARRAIVEAAAERVAKMLGRDRVQNERTAYARSRQYVRDLRVASIAGGVRIRWDGSRIGWWAVEPPSVEPEEVRLELARRFLRCLGPSTSAGFAWWSGGTSSDAKCTFRELERELLEVKLDGRQAWVLKSDEGSLERASAASSVRLLPQGDPYLCAADRGLLVPDAGSRVELWPRSVWPGAVFAHGELAGTWRRQQGRVIVRPWGKLSSEIMDAVDAEVQSMPIESAKKEVRWEPVLGSR